MRTVEKISLLSGPTPLSPLLRLSAFLGGPEIWIKREDLTPIAGGGNKVRKLEYLVGDAIASGCDTLVTIGAVQSNHVRQTLGVAASQGMLGVGILIEEARGCDGQKLGNIQLDQLLGGELVRGSKFLSYSEALDRELSRQSKLGRRPYAIPAGGSNAVGFFGSLDLAKETAQQLSDAGIQGATIVLATGTGGSQAGFISASSASHVIARVIGVSVGADHERQVAKVARSLDEIAIATHPKTQSTKAAIEVADGYKGPSYGVPHSSTLDAIRLVARLEGIFLDPVYTGKAMAGLIGLVTSGEIRKADTVVFLHSGGTPALSAFDLERTYE